MLINSQAAMTIAFFVSFASVAWSIAYVMGKRIDAGRNASPGPDLPEKLQRMENALDAIAIEIERLGEAQRFAERTRLRAAERDHTPVITPH